MYHMQIYKSGLFTSTLVDGNTVVLIKIDGWKDFMFRNEKFPDFEHSYKLFKYFHNESIDSNNTL